MSSKEEIDGTELPLVQSLTAEAMMELISGIMRSMEEADEGKTEQDTNAKIVNSSGKATGFLLCDLCNAVVNGSVTAHVADEHGNVGRAIEVVAHERVPTKEDPNAWVPCRDSENEQLNVKVGAYACLSVSSADRGEEMFNVITKATDQMRALLDDERAESRLFLFGSCVTMGLWDGIGDADYTFFLPRETDEKTGEPSRSAQRTAILDLARKLRHGGFQFAELDPVVHARVPVVRRKRNTKRRHELRHQGELYLVEFLFSNAEQKSAFVHHASKTLTQQFGAQAVTTGASKTTLVYGFADGANAIKVFARRERVGEPTKRWKMHCRLPEVFSVDFDLSCRVFGVRNSWFLRKYMKQHPIFRVGNLFMKQWSKQCGINNSRCGFLTSYAVSTLWVYYLLRTGQATFVDPASVPETPTAEACATVPYMPLWPLPKDDTESLAALGAAIRGFFRFYAETFDWANEVVSLRHDCTSNDPAMVTTKEAVGWTLANETDSIILRDRLFYRVCIEDVYETNLNLGRHLSPQKAEWFRAQFRNAWAWCNSSNSTNTILDGSAVREVGAWFSLLSDGYLQRAELTLRTAMWRHILFQGGSTSVRALKVALQRDHADLLSTYELFHRFSDLWYDYDVMAEDAKNNERHNRVVEETAVAPALHDKHTWAAVCSTSLLPVPDGQDKDDRDNRIVFLANGDIMPSRPLSASEHAVAEKLDEAHLVFREAAQTVLGLLENMSMAAADSKDEERGMVMPTDIRTASELVTNAFFTTDGLAFGTFRARSTFGEHLGAVAEALSNPETARDVANALHGNKRKDGAAAVAPLVGAFYVQASGSAFNPDLVSFIFSLKQYVRRHATTGNPEATPLLLTHLAKDENEEAKQRVAHPPHKKTPKGTANVAVLRDPSTGMIGRCTQCGKPNVMTYATNRPKMDEGRYCMVCWDAY